jgi:two-component system, OmpR family, response regulator
VTKILMADDDQAFLKVVSRFLSQAGYEVVTAANGRDALERAQAEKPDAAVLDVALPFITGEELAKQLAPGLPIVFVSGRDLDRVEGLRGEQYRFLQKPADLDDILASLRAVLGEGS